jgi:hypothetical protein
MRRNSSSSISRVTSDLTSLIYRAGRAGDAWQALRPEYDQRDDADQRHLG